MSDPVQEYADALFDLMKSGGAATADECFGIQLALPEGSPSEAYEDVYGTAVTTMSEMVLVIARRRRVPADVKIDRMLLSMAMEAFDRRWADLNARLAPGGAA
ncbi:hypothetical protein [Devosia sp. Root635]|uniref:hypothetical protein n=1 Tax=Devosia sp. Root635 TaxID=1736575 RepID=UPI0006FE6E86|nr:hypothetical protein [Devosia sp. Root635]KRA42053.1 hypothetical protein ASD80_10020 [Devosia sp. Root635]